MAVLKRFIILPKQSLSCTALSEVEIELRGRLTEAKIRTDAGVLPGVGIGFLCEAKLAAVSVLDPASAAEIVVLNIAETAEV